MKALFFCSKNIILDKFVLTLSASKVKGSTVIGNLPLLFMVDHWTRELRLQFEQRLFIAAELQQLLWSSLELEIRLNAAQFSTYQDSGHWGQNGHNFPASCNLELHGVHWCHLCRQQWPLVLRGTDPATCKVSPSVEHADRTLCRVRGSNAGFL